MNKSNRDADFCDSLGNSVDLAASAQAPANGSRTSLLRRAQQITGRVIARLLNRVGNLAEAPAFVLPGRPFEALEQRVMLDATLDAAGEFTLYNGAEQAEVIALADSSVLNGATVTVNINDGAGPDGSDTVELVIDDPTPGVGDAITVVVLATGPIHSITYNGSARDMVNLQIHLLDIEDDGSGAVFGEGGGDLTGGAFSAGGTYTASSAFQGALPAAGSTLSADGEIGTVTFGDTGIVGGAINLLIEGSVGTLDFGHVGIVDNSTLNLTVQGSLGEATFGHVGIVENSALNLTVQGSLENATFGNIGVVDDSALNFTVQGSLENATFGEVGIVDDSALNFTVQGSLENATFGEVGLAELSAFGLIVGGTLGNADFGDVDATTATLSISASGGVTAASFEDVSLTNAALSVSGPTIDALAFGDLTLEAATLFISATTLTAATFGNVGLDQGATLSIAAETVGTVDVGNILAAGAASLTVSGDSVQAVEFGNAELTAGSGISVSGPSLGTIGFGDLALQESGVAVNGGSLASMQTGDMSLQSGSAVSVGADTMGELAFGDVQLSQSTLALSGGSLTSLMVGDVSMEAGASLSLGFGDMGDIEFGTLDASLGMMSVGGSTLTSLVLGDASLDQSSTFTLSVGTTGSLRFGAVDLTASDLHMGGGAFGAIELGDVRLASDASLTLGTGALDTLEAGAMSVSESELLLSGGTFGSLTTGDISLDDARFVVDPGTLGAVTFGDVELDGSTLTLDSGSLAVGSAVEVGDILLTGDGAEFVVVADAIGDATLGDIDFAGTNSLLMLDALGDIGDVTFNSVDFVDFDALETSLWTVTARGEADDSTGSLGAFAILERGDSNTAMSEGSALTGVFGSTVSIAGDVYGTIELVANLDEGTVGRGAWGAITIDGDVIFGFLSAPDGIESLTVTGIVVAPVIDADSDYQSEGSAAGMGATEDDEFRGSLGPVLIGGGMLDAELYATAFEDITITAGPVSGVIVATVEPETEEDGEAHIASIGRVHISGWLAGELSIEADDGIEAVVIEGSNPAYGAFESEAVLLIDADADLDGTGVVGLIRIVERDLNPDEILDLHVLTGAYDAQGNVAPGLDVLEFFAGLGDSLRLDLLSNGDVNRISVGAASGLAQTGNNDLILLADFGPGIGIGLGSDGSPEDPAADSNLGAIYVGSTQADPTTVVDPDSDLAKNLGFDGGDGPGGGQGPGFVPVGGGILVTGSIGEIIVGGRIGQTIMVPEAIPPEFAGDGAYSDFLEFLGSILGDLEELTDPQNFMILLYLDVLLNLTLIQADSDGNGVGGNIDRVFAAAGDGSTGSFWNTFIDAPHATVTDGTLLQTQSYDALVSNEVAVYSVASTNAETTAHVYVSHVMPLILMLGETGFPGSSGASGPSGPVGAPLDAPVFDPDPEDLETLITPHVPLFAIYELQDVGPEHDFGITSRLKGTTTNGFDGEDVVAPALFQAIEVGPFPEFEDSDPPTQAPLPELAEGPDADLVDGELRETSIRHLVLEAGWIAGGDSLTGPGAPRIDLNNGEEAVPNDVGTLELLTIEFGLIDPGALFGEPGTLDYPPLEIDVESLDGLILGGATSLDSILFHTTPGADLDPTRRGEDLTFSVPGFGFLVESSTSFYFRSAAFADAHDEALPGDPILGRLFDQEIRFTPVNQKHSTVTFSATGASGGLAINGDLVHAQPVVGPEGAVSGFAIGSILIEGEDPAIEATSSVAEIVSHVDLAFVEIAGALGSLELIDNDPSDGESVDLGNLAVGFWVGSDSGPNGIFDARDNGDFNPAGGPVRHASVIAPGVNVSFEDELLDGVRDDFLIASGAADLGPVRIDGEWLGDEIYISGSMLGDVQVGSEQPGIDFSHTAFVVVGDDVTGDWLVHGDISGALIAGVLKIHSDEATAVGEDGYFFGAVDNVDEGGVSATTGANASLVLSDREDVTVENYPASKIESAIEFFDSAGYQAYVAGGVFFDLYSGSVANGGAAIMLQGTEPGSDMTMHLVAADDVLANIDSAYSIGLDLPLVVIAVTGNIGLVDAPTLWQTRDAQVESPFMAGIALSSVYSGGSFYTDIDAGSDAGAGIETALLVVSSLEVDETFGRPGEGTTVWRADGTIVIESADIGFGDATGTMSETSTNFLIGDAGEGDESWLVTLLQGLELGFDPSDGVDPSEVTQSGASEAEGQLVIISILIDDNFGSWGQTAAHGLLASGDVVISGQIRIGGVARSGLGGYAASVANDPGDTIDEGGSFLTNFVAGITDGNYINAVGMPPSGDLIIGGIMAVDDDLGELASEASTGNVLSASGSVVAVSLRAGVSFTTFTDPTSPANGTIDLNNDGVADSFFDLNGDGVVDSLDAVRSPGDFNVDVVAGMLADTEANRAADLRFQPVFANVRESDSGVPGGGLPQLANLPSSVTIASLSVGYDLDGGVAAYFPDDPDTAEFEGPGNFNGTVIGASHVTVLGTIAGNLIGNDGAGGRVLIAGAGHIDAIISQLVATLTVRGDTVGSFASGMFVPLDDTAANPLDVNDQVSSDPTDVELQAGTVLTLGSMTVFLTTGRLRGEFNGSQAADGITLDEVLTGEESLAGSAYIGRTTFASTDSATVVVNALGRPFTEDQVVLGDVLIQGDGAGTLTPNAADGDITAVSMLAFNDLTLSVNASDTIGLNFVLSNVDAVTAFGGSDTWPSNPSSPNTNVPLNSAAAGDIVGSIVAQGKGEGGLDVAYMLAGFDIFSRINVANPEESSGAPVTAVATMPTTPDFWASFGLGSNNASLTANDGDPTNGFSAGVLSFALIAAGNSINGDMTADGDIVARLGSTLTDGAPLLPDGSDGDIIAGASVVLSVDPLAETEEFAGGGMFGDIIAGDDIYSQDEGDPLITIAAIGGGDGAGTFSSAIVAGQNVQIDGPDILGLGNDEASNIDALIIASDTLNATISGDNFTGGIHVGAGPDLDINTAEDNLVGDFNGVLQFSGDVDVRDIGDRNMGILATGDIDQIWVGGDLLGDVVSGGDIAVLIVDGNIGMPGGDGVILASGTIGVLEADTIFSDLFVGLFIGGSQIDMIDPDARVLIGTVAAPSADFSVPGGGGHVQIDSGQAFFLFTGGLPGSEANADLTIIVFDDGSGPAPSITVTGGSSAGLSVRQIITGDDLNHVSIISGSLGQLVVDDDLDISDRIGEVALLEEMTERFPFLLENFQFVDELARGFHDQLTAADLLGDVTVQGNIGITAPDEMLIPSGDISIGQGLNEDRDNVAIRVEGSIDGTIRSTAGSIGNVVADDLGSATFHARENIGSVYLVAGSIESSDAFISELGSLGVLRAYGSIISPTLEILGDLGGFIAETGDIDLTYAGEGVYTHGSIGFLHASGHISAILQSETGSVGFDLDPEDRFELINTAGIYSYIGDIDVDIRANAGLLIDPDQLDVLAGEPLPGVATIVAALGDVAADIETGGSVGTILESGQVVGGIAAPLGSISGSLHIAGDLGGLAALSVDVDTDVHGSIGLLKDGQMVAGSRTVHHVTAQNPLLVVTPDGTDYRVVVGAGSASVTWNVSDGRVVFEEIIYRVGEGEAGSLEVLTTRGGRNAGGTFSDAAAMTRVDFLHVEGNLQTLTIEGELGEATIEGDLGSATTPPAVRIEGGRFDALETGGTNYGHEAISIGVFRDESGAPVINRAVSIANPHATGPHDAFITVMLIHGSGMVHMNNGYLESITLDGAGAKSLYVGAHDSAIEGEDIFALREALAATQDGRGSINLGEINLGTGIHLSDVEVEGNVGTISSEANRSMMGNIRIHGDVEEIRSSGALAKLFVDGDAGRIDGGVALRQVDIEGDAEVLQATHDITGVTVGGDLGRAVASGTLASLFVGGNAGSLSAGTAMGGVFVHGSAIQISAQRMVGVSVAGSVGVAVLPQGDDSFAPGAPLPISVGSTSGDAFLTLGGVHGDDGFTLREVAHALGISDAGSDAEIAEALYGLGDDGPGESGARYLGGINAGLLARVAVGGLIADLTVTQRGLIGSLVNQTVDDVHAIGHAVSPTGMPATGHFIQENGRLLHFGRLPVAELLPGGIDSGSDT